MPIQYVNTGSSANAGNGDTLRTAFNKINNNFVILSTSTLSAGPTGPTGIAGPTGPTGIAGPTGPAGIQATLTSVDSHIIPASDLTYDLGSTSSQWRSLYVGTSTIYLGGTALSVSGGNLTLDGSPVAGGGGPVLTDRLTSSTFSIILEGTTGTVSVPNSIISQSYQLNLAGSQYSYDVGRYLRVRDGDFESHLHLDTPDNSLYDIILGDDNKFVRVDHTGTVVIGTNDETQRLWTFDKGGHFNIPSSIEFNSLSTTSTIGTMYGQSEGMLIGGYSGKNVKIGTNDGTSEWTFGTDGLLTLPSNNTTIGSFYGSDAILCSTGTAFGIVSQGSGSSVLQWLDDVAAPNVVAGIAANSLYSNTGSVQIFTGSIGSPPQHTWTFNNNGELALPGNINSINSISLVAGDAVNITSNNTVDAKTLIFDETGTLTFPSSGNIVFDNSATSYINGVTGIEFANGTTSTGHMVFANSSSYKIQTISFGGSPSNIVSTFEFGVGSITIPGNGTIYNEGQEGYWGLDGANQQLTFPNLSRISYGLGNVGLTVDDLKIQAINTGNVVVSANGEDWVFSTTGNLQFPDGSIQTTAYTGIASSGTTATSAAVGYIGMPQNNQTSNYIVALSDQGKHIYCTGTSFTVTIPANTVTSFPIGSSVAFIAGPTTTATIAIQTDTMYLGGSTGTSGTRTLSPFGMATAVKVDSTTWFISGAGLA